jgi:nicotinamidase-related amidase
MREALLVLDAQQIYTDKESELYCIKSAKTIDNINKLIIQTVDRGQLLILVRHIHKLNGSDIGNLFNFTGEEEEDFNFKEGSEEVKFDKDLLRPSNALELRKTRYSAFQRTKLERILKKEKVQRVIICGFMTNFCCDSTARDAFDRDFYVDIVIDATGTPGTESLSQDKVRNITSEILGSGYARIKTTRDILSLWKKA